MNFHFHLNFSTRKITIHRSSCCHWKKWIGTKRHKHGSKNSMHFPENPFGIKGYELIKKIVTSLARSERYKYHECMVCKPGQLIKLKDF
jgi:hypothetical protein